jgi:hypothetical protein
MKPKPNPMDPAAIARRKARRRSRNDPRQDQAQPKHALGGQQDHASNPYARRQRRDGERWMHNEEESR